MYGEVPSTTIESTYIKCIVSKILDRKVGLRGKGLTK